MLPDPDLPVPRDGDGPVLENTTEVEVEGDPEDVVTDEEPCPLETVVPGAELCWLELVDPSPLDTAGPGADTGELEVHFHCEYLSHKNISKFQKFLLKKICFKRRQ